MLPEIVESQSEYDPPVEEEY